MHNRTADRGEDLNLCADLLRVITPSSLDQAAAAAAATATQLRSVLQPRTHSRSHTTLSSIRLRDTSTHRATSSSIANAVIATGVCHPTQGITDRINTRTCRFNTQEKNTNTHADKPAIICLRNISSSALCVCVCVAGRSVADRCSPQEPPHLIDAKFLRSDAARTKISKINVASAINVEHTSRRTHQTRDRTK